MSEPESVPTALVHDAIAVVDEGLRLRPVTGAMRALLAAHGDDGALPWTADEREALHVGAPFAWQAPDGSAWRFEVVDHGGERWLVGRAAARDDDGAVRLAAARARAFAAVAGNLAHDLNNHFNTLLALAAQVEGEAADPEDAALIAELVAGARGGARLVSTVARMLRAPRAARAVAPASVLEDALAVVRKSLQTNDVELQVDVDEGLPAVAVDELMAVQAMIEVVNALGDARPTRLRCELRRARTALAAGRERDCVMLRCSAAGLDEPARARLRQVVTGAVAQTPSLVGLATAAFAARRAGGTLRVVDASEGVALELVWPT